MRYCILNYKLITHVIENDLCASISSVRDSLNLFSPLLYKKTIRDHLLEMLWTTVLSWNLFTIRCEMGDIRGDLQQGAKLAIGKYEISWNDENNVSIYKKQSSSLGRNSKKRKLTAIFQIKNSNGDLKFENGQGKATEEFTVTNKKGKALKCLAPTTYKLRVCSHRRLENSRYVENEPVQYHKNIGPYLRSYDGHTTAEFGNRKIICKSDNLVTQYTISPDDGELVSFTPDDVFDDYVLIHKRQDSIVSCYVSMYDIGDIQPIRVIPAGFNIYGKHSSTGQIISGTLKANGNVVQIETTEIFVFIGASFTDIFTFSTTTYGEGRGHNTIYFVINDVYYTVSLEMWNNYRIQGKVFKIGNWFFGGNEDIGSFVQPKKEENRNWDTEYLEESPKMLELDSKKPFLQEQLSTKVLAETLSNAFQ
eukprot:NODE_186_length_13589_cov_0.385545.p2 type:complete len:421 gc:universal NODE_186_length_13589_cov_0.385545:9028-10290(+)